MFVLAEVSSFLNHLCPYRSDVTIKYKKMGWMYLGDAGSAAHKLSVKCALLATGFTHLKVILVPRVF